MTTQVDAAIILAAGLGMRMRPLTLDRPKPLISVAGKPLLDYAIELVKQAGIPRIVVNTAYLAQQIESHLANQPHICISREHTPLETGGGIAHALPLLATMRPFMALNSDTILLPGNMQPLLRMAAAWDDTIDVLLLLQPLERAVGYSGRGDFFCDESGEIRRRGDRSQAPYVFTGVQMIHPRLFNDCPIGAFSMNLLYDRAGTDNVKLTRIRGLVHDGDWLHIGTPGERDEAERFLAAA